jgi:23S rRNA (cytidine1920-2'-O)/16S rRNA (cytidine1409-2'-O)-methyltransferase
MSMNSFHARALRPSKNLAAPRRADPQDSQGMRADALLVQQGLAPSRTAAQRLIETGRVRYRPAGAQAWVAVTKASARCAANATLVVLSNDAPAYVSRGGLKLAGALAHTGIDARGRHCLDIGQATGGFTDCLLQHGAAHVVGIDVGHRQLHPRLAADARVEAYEGINARALTSSLLAGRRFELIVADVAFISLTLIIPQLPPFLAAQGDLLLLAKPQFEVGKENIGKGGIVTDASLYAGVRDKLAACCRQHHLAVCDWFDSPIAGSDGNREFFLHARHEA